MVYPESHPEPVDRIDAMQEIADANPTQPRVVSRIGQFISPLHQNASELAGRHDARTLLTAAGLRLGRDGCDRLASGVFAVRNELLNSEKA